ncbi:MAG: rhamnogalacturonan acetylesterase [Prolixibacteraceae bacterium]|nr:rhamnogalacturonan acetylesterase [Prolixibacteraceae bacterium]MBN2772978.1 rhamnogalacturonan acetylesterase [Prolixibacteraceae bacterium]
MVQRIFLLFLVFIWLNACKSDNKSYTIYTIGDSTMANKKSEVYPETGWCQVINKYFNKTITFQNHAVNGRSSKSFIDEGRWQVVLDSLKKGDYVFIQFGHNDQKEYDSTRYTTPFGTYNDNLRKFVKETRDRGATPILITSIVRRKFGEDGKLIDTHGDYPLAMKEVAKELNVDLIDLQKITEDWVNKLGDEPSKEMYLWTSPNEKYSEGRKDDTHLSEAGADHVAKLMLEECIKKNLGFSGEIIQIVGN